MRSKTNKSTAAGKHRETNEQGFVRTIFCRTAAVNKLHPQDVKR